MELTLLKSSRVRYCNTIIMSLMDNLFLVFINNLRLFLHHSFSSLADLNKTNDL